MKKILCLFSCLCTFAFGQTFADYSPEEQCCDRMEYPCGTCYCLYCKYEPCYYNTYKCVSEPKCCKKKCYRWVPKYYEKCCVKYVPQYYTQTCCKYEQECYEVETTEYCKKRVCEKQCKMVPKYYWKCSQGPSACPTACN
jgi:hypothetical protein